MLKGIHTGLDQRAAVAVDLEGAHTPPHARSRRGVGRQDCSDGSARHRRARPRRAGVALYVVAGVGVTVGVTLEVGSGRIVAVAGGTLVAVTDGVRVDDGVGVGSSVMLFVPHADKASARTVAANQVVRQRILMSPSP